MCVCMGGSVHVHARAGVNDVCVRARARAHVGGLLLVTAMQYWYSGLANAATKHPGLAFK